MTTAAQAYAVVRARLEANVPAGLSALRWQDEEADSNGEVELPEVPAAFAYTEFLAERSAAIEIGSGRGGNRHRNPGRLDVYVFAPKGQGVAVPLALADAIATLYRPFRSGGVSCVSATSYPGGDGAELTPKGLSSEVGNYFWALCEVELYFDLTG